MADSEKMVSLDTLAKITASLKNENKKVVLCHGTFDLLHIGHIKHLQAAKKLGDVLLVTITADPYVNKGPDRPVFNHHLRAENLSALECVTYVAINYTETSVNVLEQLKPDIYVKGDEYKEEEGDVTGNISKERETVEKHGGCIEYTQEVTFSSSKLLNEYFEVFTPQTKQFIDDFKTEYSAEFVHEQLGLLEQLKVVIIGDAILDEYHYIDLLGQSGKGNFQSARYMHEEKFAGGAFAVANHIAGFVNDVTLLTAIGSNPKDKDFIESKLKENINPLLFQFTQAPTLTKRRYVDCEMNKLFEIYYTETNPMDEILETRMVEWISENLGKFDVVVIPDFGNGLITQKMVNVISEHANFLAVNTQLNSGNRGYHVITRYPRANFISLNEPEIRMAAHDRHNPLAVVGKKISQQLGSSFTAITRGVNGVMILDNDTDELFEIPAISTKVVDRIGAGDAFLSLSSICLGAKMQTKLATFIGNVAAALNVQVICNREPVNSVAVKKYVTTLLK